MTIAELRSLASYHEGAAVSCRKTAACIDEAAERSRLMALASWHADVAEKITVLANTFEACGRLLTNITGNYP